ncbi:PSP1 C-terminal domain-containing protein [Paludisphaera soli]|uniref:PSP1 C-terminal domain-containing protein n=1 Tax=Paludisphaera soli TaxID=2712865 RepID=UPI0013ED81EA|nr:PSP1 C-terminal domain-containing protein [Paludisphaera soli]
MDAGTEAVAGIGEDSGAECLVRYGLAGRVGWFAADDGPTPLPARGESVVVRSSRGVELGEVLAGESPGRGRAGEDSVGAFRVLRRADADDQARAHEAERLRERRFDLCRRIADEAGWPLELVDVEPLLDFSTVLHVLTFDDLDPAPIRARYRMSCDFDVFIEDLTDGSAAGATATEPEAEPAAAGRCGDCDCGGGGCSRKAAKLQTRADAAETLPKPGGGCSTASGGGCSSCGVSAWKKAKAGPSGAVGE